MGVFAPRSHSRNIAVRPQVGIVIFDSTVAIGAAEALYLEAVAEQLSGAAIDSALAAFSAPATSGYRYELDAGSVGRCARAAAHPLDGR